MFMLSGSFLFHHSIAYMVLWHSTFCPEYCAALHQEVTIERGAVSLHRAVTHIFPLNHTSCLARPNENVPYINSMIWFFGVLSSL